MGAAVLSTRGLMETTMRWTARSDTATASRPRRYAVLAAHGGAGVSTVLGLLALAYSGTDGLEVVELTPGSPLPASAEPVLVTRNSAAGLGAAARVLATWNPSDVQPWFVVMADAPAKPSFPARYRRHVLSGQVRSVIDLPFLWPLRAVDQVSDAASSRSVLRAARALRNALEKG
jgi:hypothetical protein